MAFVIGVKRLKDLIIDTAKDWLGYSIKNVGVPTDATDAARKQEVDAKVSKAGDTMTGALIADRDVASTDTRIYKNLASYKNSSNIVGTLKISLPKSWSNTALRIRIISYESAGYDNNTFEVIIGGINDTFGWLYYSAELRGTASLDAVRLGHDGSVCCILLGTTATTWWHPHIVVDELIVSGSNITGWESGWQISVIGNESGITNIVTPTLQKFWHKGNLNINRWVQPGDNILLEALTERYSGDVTGTIVKQFRVNRPGRYRITGELRASSSSGYVYADIMWKENRYINAFSTNSTSYVAFSIDVPGTNEDYILPGETIRISIWTEVSGNYVYIRNVRLRYADASEPSASVLLN